MKKNVAIAIQMMGEDSEKNIRTINKFGFVTDVFYDFSAALIDAAHSKTKGIKRIRFLIAFCSIAGFKNYEFFSINKPISQSYIYTFLKHIRINGDVEQDINTYKELINFFKLIFDQGYNFYIECEDEINTIGIASVITKHLSDNCSSDEDKALVTSLFNELKLKLYEKDFYGFINNLDELDKAYVEDKIFELYDNPNYFGKNGTLLHYCILSSCNFDTKLDMIKILLELGVNPNTLNLNETSFISLAIKNNSEDNEFLYNIIVEALKYGFDVNVDAMILPWLLHYSTNVSKILNLLLENGLDLTKFNKKEIDDFGWKQENFKEVEMIYSYIDNYEIIFGMINKLNDEKYRLEDNFFSKLYKNSANVNDVLEKISRLSSLENPLEFSNLWCDTIIENRNNSINFTDEEITVKEAISALKNIIDTFVSNLNNDIQEWENKIHIYCNKVNN